MPLEQVGRYRVSGKAYQGKGCLRYPAVDTLLGREVVLRIAPAFVFLRDDDEPVLFGFEPEASSADPLLRVDPVVENARYLAPEAVRKEPIDARTDLWSLGVLVFHLLTGKYPFERSDALAVMDEIAGPREAPAAATLRGDLPAGVGELIGRLLQKDPSRRPAHAEAVREEIEALLGEAISPGAETVRLPDGAPGGLRRYAILERVGSGAFGVVFRARERATGRTVALKFLRPDLVEDPQAAARFRREAEVARAIDHPNVVRVIDAGRDGEAAFVAMEFVEGPSLAARLRKGSLPWREAARIAADVLDALAAAHARAIVHRDLKPANIILRGGESPVILDFRSLSE